MVWGSTDPTPRTTTTVPPPPPTLRSKSRLGGEPASEKKPEGVGGNLGRPVDPYRSRADDHEVGGGGGTVVVVLTVPTPRTTTTVPPPPPTPSIKKSNGSRSRSSKQIEQVLEWKDGSALSWRTEASGPGVGGGGGTVVVVRGVGSVGTTEPLRTQQWGATGRDQVATRGPVRPTSASDVVRPAHL